MNKAIHVSKHLRARVSLAWLFSLTCICGLPVSYVAARAGQNPPEKRTENKRERDAKDRVDRERPAGLSEQQWEEAKKAAEGRFKNDLKPTDKGAVFDPFSHAPSERPRKGRPTITPFNRNIGLQIPSRLKRLDLRAVHKINNRFLLDVPMLSESLLPLLENPVPPRQRAAFDAREFRRAGLEKEFANTRVITAAKLGDGTEVLTVIDMPYSLDAGTLIGRMVELTKNADNTEQVRKIVGEQGQGSRVFFYGNDLHNVDLASIAHDTGVEVVRRTDKTQDLVSVQKRLNAIAARGFDPQNAVIVNGLPTSKEAVESMGLFTGRVESWLKFRESINSITPDNIKTTSEKESFFRELQHGDSDLLVVVAHSDGLHFFLDGRRVSLKEINELPERQERSGRPRLAILISCSAGKADSPSIWNWIFEGDYAPLGHLLVEKGFVDKVIAPDHDIGSDEALEIFRKALSGVTQSIFKHWNEWVVRFHPRFEVAS